MFRNFPVLEPLFRRETVGNKKQNTFVFLEVRIIMVLSMFGPVKDIGQDSRY